uniref:Uncharacterized protein n=1 Tax=Podarcis muralis TaxID=64176 RepID=A0A670JHY1_PODMU
MSTKSSCPAKPQNLPLKWGLVMYISDLQHNLTYVASDVRPTGFNGTLPGKCRFEKLKHVAILGTVLSGSFCIKVIDKLPPT